MRLVRPFAALTFAALVLPSFSAPAQVAQADGTTLTVAGSTALLPLLRASAELYQSRRPQTQITVTGGGSRAGISEVAAGNIDLGMSDTPATGFPNLVDHQVCVVGFTVLVNPGAGVSNVSAAQLRDIFAGKTTNWKDLGGADLKIAVIDRPRGSATRLALQRTIMGATPIADSGSVEDATAPLLGDVRSTPGAISYAAFVGIKTYQDDRFSAVEGVVELSIDGAGPSEADIGAGKYPFWAYEHVYSNGPPSREASRVLALVETNVDAIHAAGFIPLRAMRASAAH